MHLTHLWPMPFIKCLNLQFFTWCQDFLCHLHIWLVRTSEHSFLLNIIYLNSPLIGHWEVLQFLLSNSAKMTNSVPKLCLHFTLYHKERFLKLGLLDLRLWISLRFLYLYFKILLNEQMKSETNLRYVFKWNKVKNDWKKFPSCPNYLLLSTTISKTNKKSLILKTRFGQNQIVLISYLLKIWGSLPWKGKNYNKDDDVDNCHF